MIARARVAVSGEKKQQEMEEAAKVTQSPPRLPGYTPQPWAFSHLVAKGTTPRLRKDV